MPANFEALTLGGIVGRAIAYVGLGCVSLGVLGIIASLATASAVLSSFGSVLLGLGLLTVFIGVGVHLLNRIGGSD